MLSLRAPPRHVVVTAMGISQILGWGTSFYFPAVFSAPIVADTGWPLGWVVGGITIGLLVAGLISPAVGRVVGRKGGRPVLAASSLLFALGLAGIGLSPVLPVYLLSWAVVGAAMATGLYDAAFAALGRLYGAEARGPITSLTLFGGFASTVCWPLSAYLIELCGWRGACLIYAGLHLAVALPLQLVMPAHAADVVSKPADLDLRPVESTSPSRETPIFVLLALVLTLAGGIGSILVVHMLTFLQARGVEFAAAVTLGTLFGPAQVAARVIERMFGAHYHPIWTMIAACALMAIGLLLLFLLAGLPILVLAITLYGAGYGILWVARGTLPLALFGPARFPRLMGRLGFPSLIVLACTPFAGALLIEWYGVDLTIALLTGSAMINLALVAILWRVSRFHRAGAI